MKRILFSLFLLFFAYSGLSQFANPFVWETGLKDNILEVKVAIPANHYLYKKTTKITVSDAKNKAIKALSIPKNILHNDAFSGKVAIYPSSKASIWTYNLKTYSSPFKIIIDFQGCRDQTSDSAASCFMPGQKTFVVGKAKVKTKNTSQITKDSQSELFNTLQKFKISETLKGGANVEKFMPF